MQLFSDCIFVQQYTPALPLFLASICFFWLQKSGGLLSIFINRLWSKIVKIVINCFHSSDFHQIFKPCLQEGKELYAGICACFELIINANRAIHFMESESLLYSTFTQARSQTAKRTNSKSSPLLLSGHLNPSYIIRTQ